MEAWSPIWMESNLTEYWLNHHIFVSNIYILLQVLSINKDRACHHKNAITSFWWFFQCLFFNIFVVLFIINLKISTTTKKKAKFCFVINKYM